MRYLTPMTPYRRISNIVSTTAEFGVIPHDHWFQPDWIDETKATAGREKMVKDNIIYGGALSLSLLALLRPSYMIYHRQRLVP